MADSEALIARVVVPKRLVASTLRSIRWAGRCGKERVVLWLGRRTDAAIDVVRVHVPKQVSGRDVFRIPPPSMRALMELLRTENLMVAAQVHSHPREAFHSQADDEWAIVRHVDALSLVLPYFGRRVTAASFLRDAATFRLTAENIWEQVEATMLAERIEVTP
jgi:hypothetical protein